MFLAGMIVRSEWNLRRSEDGSPPFLSSLLAQSDLKKHNDIVNACPIPSYIVLDEKLLIVHLEMLNVLVAL